MLRFDQVADDAGSCTVTLDQGRYLGIVTTGTDDFRSMLFELDPDDVVLGSRVGADSLVRRPSMCR